jgi:hypothetical protein
MKLLKGPETCRKAVIDLVLSKSQESEVSVWYELRRYLVKNIWHIHIYDCMYTRQKG